MGEEVGRKPMWSRTTLMDLQGSMPSSRVDWADMAKAISIILLVFWTTVGGRIYLNEMLIFVRMPLFFFVSGLFAYRVVTRPDLTTFLRDKVGNLLYLYALWIGLLFLSTDLVAHLWYGAPIDPLRQLQLFWDPLLTIWFLYALALAFVIARLARNLPIWIVLAVSCALYLASVASGEWRHMPFLERLIRLFPFFWLGLVAMPVAPAVVARFRRFWPLAAGLFLALSWTVFDSPLSAWGVVTFPITLIGILALVLLSGQLANQSWAWPLGVVGSSTLFIYVMHKIVLFYMQHGLNFLDVDFSGIEAAKVAPVVAICVIFGRWAQHRSWTAWLFAAPWISRRTKIHAAPVGA